MGAICNQWAHFGHSGSKHSECAQFLTIRYIMDPLQRTFKIYPNFNHWVHCGQVLSVPTMYSPCAYWVYGSLSPVGGSWEVRSISRYLPQKEQNQELQELEPEVESRSLMEEGH